MSLGECLASRLAPQLCTTRNTDFSLYPRPRETEPTGKYSVRLISSLSKMSCFSCFHCSSCSLLLKQEVCRVLSETTLDGGLAVSCRIFQVWRGFFFVPLSMLWASHDYLHKGSFIEKSYSVAVGGPRPRATSSHPLVCMPYDRKWWPIRALML